MYWKNALKLIGVLLVLLIIILVVPKLNLTSSDNSNDPTSSEYNPFHVFTSTEPEYKKFLRDIDRELYVIYDISLHSAYFSVTYVDKSYCIEHGIKTPYI
jgi:hypothetical protein